MFKSFEGIFALVIIVFCVMLAWAEPQIAPPETKKYPVMIINNSAPFTYWGIVKYEVAEDGQYYDYEILDGDVADRVQMMSLEPGWYAITQAQEMQQEYKGRLLKWTKIVDYVEFEVKPVMKTLVIEFP